MVLVIAFEINPFTIAKNLYFQVIHPEKVVAVL